MQVQVADVAAESARTGKADKRIEVGAVDVHLATGVVYRCADVGDLVLVDTVRGRVGDHDRGETLGVIGDLRTQIVDVDVTVGTAGDNLDAHPGHDSRSRVGAVSTRGNQAGVAVIVAATEVVVADREQARVLPLAAGVGWRLTLS